MAIYMWRDITPAWIYHSPDLWLISLSSDWTNWITIADKNLGATEVWNIWDELTNANCGNYYQWWNNYWFPWPETPKSDLTISNVQVEDTWYWPWNYYSSNVFITWWPGVDWWMPSNWNRRWFRTWTYEAMKWPCDEWFHVPTYNEMLTIFWENEDYEEYPWILRSLWLVLWEDIKDKLKLPFAWHRNLNWDVEYIWMYWKYRWCEPCETYGDWTQYFIQIRNWNNQDEETQIYEFTAVHNTTCPWYSIRPFKNTPVTPDSTRTVLYPTS